MARIREGTLIADKYRLERPLARGGMGAIWVARHRDLDMPVAVKFMDAAFAATAEGRSRFEREAKAVALIQSSNIVHIHDYGVHDDVPYMAMELLRGEDLGARIRRDGRLPVPFVSDVMTQVCKALRKAHDAGIIHRDLKPANVFLARDDDEQIVKILDFGVAKMLGVGDASEATRTGVVVGSVHYMSPEQARGVKDIDHRADLWSLGVIAFRALTGQLPFPGDQMGDVIVKICTDPVPVITQYRPELGPSAEVFFTRAFSRRRDERYPNAREFARAFAALVGGEGKPPALSPPVEPSAAAVETESPLSPPRQFPADAVTLSEAGTAEGSPPHATPLAMGLTADPPATPLIAPLFPAPAAPESGGTAVSEVVIPGVAPRLPRRALALAAVGATALALGGVLAFTRGPAPPLPAAVAAAPSSLASAGDTTAAPPAVATASATASASAAPPAPSAPAPTATARAGGDPSAKRPATPGGAAPTGKKINAELGF